MRTRLALSKKEISLLNCSLGTAPWTLQPAQMQDIIWLAATIVETILAAEDNHQSGNAATTHKVIISHFLKDHENKTKLLHLDNKKCYS